MKLERVVSLHFPLQGFEVKFHCCLALDVAQRARNRLEVGGNDEMDGAVENVTMAADPRPEE